jgi:protein-arginine kinase activator protein McsA
MTPICQQCDEEQLHVIEFTNTDGVVAYVCEHCNATNPLSELMMTAKHQSAPASAATAEASAEASDCGSAVLEAPGAYVS